MRRLQRSSISTTTTKPSSAEESWAAATRSPREIQARTMPVVKVGTPKKDTVP